MAMCSVALRGLWARSGGEGDACASASLRDAVPRAAQRNPSGSRNKGLRTSSAAARDATASRRDALLAQALVAAAERVAISQTGSLVRWRGRGGFALDDLPGE